MINVKMRYSIRREMIYEYVKSSSEHPSAETIYDKLKHTIKNLSLGTVYRNLKQLEELGKIKRVTTTVQNSERYDPRCDNHSHFICERCGSITDLAVIDIESAKKTSDVLAKANINWADATFGGICEKCQKEIDKTT